MSESNVQFERLWAPWRIGYVTGEDARNEGPSPHSEKLLPNADGACFLCHAAAGPTDDANDRSNRVIWRRNQTVTVLNRYPYNNGHLLVAPRAHAGLFQDIPAKVHAEIADTIGHLLSGMERVLCTDGFNVGLNLGQVAGAGLPGHLHWHIVPRWNGDHNFMPTLAGTRVIPQSLDAAWAVLREIVGSRQ